MATPISDPRPSFLVGIAGGTASGKTTLATRVAERLGEQCLLISHDRYYRDVPTPIGHNYDSPDALDNALLSQNLQALARGQHTRLPIYDFSTHSRSQETEAIQPCPVVIVEGILILAIPTLRELFHFTVFVEAEEEIRLNRRISRDQADRGRSREQILAQYHQTVKPMHELHVAPSQKGVDLLLRGDGSLEGAEAQLFEAITHYSGLPPAC